LPDQDNTRNNIRLMAWQMIADSNDLEADVMFFLHMIDDDIMYYGHNTIWHYIVKNPHFEENARFIGLLLNHTIKGQSKLQDKYQDLKINEVDARSSIYIDDRNGEIALFILLKRLFPDVLTNTTHERNTHKSIVFGDNNRTPVYDSYTSPTNERELKTYLRIPLFNLIKFSTKKFRLTRFEKTLDGLFAYRDVLRGWNIDIDQFFRDVLPSPPPITTDKRSLNVPSDIVSVNSLFSGFIDDILMKKLEKIYTKTIQSDDATTNNFNRILKIRNFIHKKYEYMIDDTKGAEIRLYLDEDKDLEELYNEWMKRGKFKLTVKYYIKYNNDPGIDAGGLTKQFFTNVMQQMKDKYFIPIEDTDRYIFDMKKITPDMAEFIGHFIFTMIMKGYKLDFNLSYFYIATLMFRPQDLKNEELFVYYLLDIDPLKKRAHIESCSTPELADDFCNITEIIEDNFDMVYHYKANPSIFEAFAKGFIIEKKIFYTKFNNINDKVRIYDMDKLITETELTYEVLKQGIFDKLAIDELEPESKVYTYLKEIMLGSPDVIVNRKFNKEAYDAEYKALYDGFDTSIIGGDADIKKRFEALKSDYEFKKNVLMFWTGSKGI
jgi:hypothetical protein